MRWRIRLAVLFGTLGVIGETAILRHQLVNCYPFKMLTYPPWRFYQQVGNAGSFVVAILAVVIVFQFATRASLLAPPAATVLAPFIYVALVVVLTAAIYGWTVPAGTRNFDGYTVVAATGEFVRSAAELAVGGLLLGSISSGLLRLATRSQRKAAA